MTWKGGHAVLHKNTQLLSIAENSMWRLARSTPTKNCRLIIHNAKEGTMIRL